MPRKKKEHLFNKYTVTKNDGFTDPEAVYFVLRLDTDPSARVAAIAYARTCLEDQYKCDLGHEIIDLVERATGE